ncbi:hypothetical protein TYRP_009646 [Tyrophagus putrescentiae]|nr:hypothetical protein TYRP_009646 [Tyrophagus putrescentiae]
MSTLLNSSLMSALRSRGGRLTAFLHSVVFGSAHLLATNALISAAMGTVGDSIQQNYDILMRSLEEEKEEKKNGEKGLKSDSTEGTSFSEGQGSKQSNGFNLVRSAHMTAAGLTTGVVTHYWYILLDRCLGSRRTPLVLAKKILLDQVVFSPVNLFVYFSTLGICERSSWRHVKGELVEKGLENIYVVEWAIWPPMQLINFALLPLRYRILFDNVVSLGFDIYSPYVKYKTELSCEQEQKKKDSNLDSNGETGSSSSTSAISKKLPSASLFSKS